MKHSILRCLNVSIATLYAIGAAYMIYVLVQNPVSDNKAPLSFTIFLATQICIFLLSKNGFKYVHNQAYMKPKHWFLLGALLIQLLIGRGQLHMYGLFALIIWSMTKNYKRTLVQDMPATSWRHSSDKALSYEKALQVLQADTSSIKVLQKDNHVTLHGQSALIFHIRVDLFPNQTKIEVTPSNSVFVFLFAIKIWPFPMGRYYGEKFLAALEEQ